MGVLLGEPFGRLRNHLVHGFDRWNQWELRALQHPGRRELMAELRVGRPGPGQDKTTEDTGLSPIQMICSAKRRF